MATQCDFRSASDITSMPGSSEIVVVVVDGPDVVVEGSVVVEVVDGPVVVVDDSVVVVVEDGPPVVVVLVGPAVVVVDGVRHS